MREVVGRPPTFNRIASIIDIPGDRYSCEYVASVARFQMKRPSGRRWRERLGELPQKVIECAYKLARRAGDIPSLFMLYCRRKDVSSRRGKDELTFSK
jgi:hypothetical protein